MIRKPVDRVVVSICGLIVVLGVAWGCDRLMQFFRFLNAQFFTLNTIILWGYALVALVLSGLWLLLAWFELIRESRNTWVSLIFLLIGLSIVAYPALYFTPLLGWLSNITLVQLAPTMYLFSTGGIVAVIGVLGLVIQRGKNKNGGRGG
jgi:hypothetical protein